MCYSMTGFGRGESIDEKRHIVVEIKSINHRYNDIVIRMPRRYSFLEDKLRSFIKNYIKRGRIEVYVSVENVRNDDISVDLNISLAEQYTKCLKSMKKEFNLYDDVSISLLSRFPDVIKTKQKEDDEEEILQCLLKGTKEALNVLNNMRKVEAKKLVEDIIKRCGIIVNYIDKIEGRSSLVVSEYKVKLRERIKELLENSVEIDENRLGMEVAIFADKSNITEELVRLNSHIFQLKNVFKEENNSIGRKLDFIIQEMNREINTIGSKANDLEITNFVVEVKSELEKIREQIQNIE